MVFTTCHCCPLYRTTKCAAARIRLNICAYKYTTHTVDGITLILTNISLAAIFQTFALLKAILDISQCYWVQDKSSCFDTRSFTARIAHAKGVWQCILVNLKCTSLFSNNGRNTSHSLGILFFFSVCSSPLTFYNKMSIHQIFL
jgi:hypothetical protein